MCVSVFCVCTCRCVCKMRSSDQALCACGRMGTGRQWHTCRSLLPFSDRVCVCVFCKHIREPEKLSVGQTLRQAVYSVVVGVCLCVRAVCSQFLPRSLESLKKMYLIKFVITIIYLQHITLNQQPNTLYSI